MPTPLAPPPLVRTVVSALVAVALLGALANALGLAASTESARVRDGATYFVARWLSDQVGFDLLGWSPRLVHREFQLRTGSGAAGFAALAAATNVVLLGLPAGLLAAAVALARRLLRRSSRAASRFEGWWPFAAPFLLLLPLLAVASHVAALGGPDWISIPTARRIAAGGALALAALGVVALRRLAAGAAERLRRWQRNLGFALAALLAVAALLPAPGGGRGGVASAPPGAPNILLVSIDTLRADHVHSYGYPRPTTPRIDRLAAEGALFEQAIAPTSWTLPSHLTLLTGVPPEIHGVTLDGRKLAASVPTLAERLRDRGYASAGFVSGAYLDGRFGMAKGFEEYDDYSLVRLAGATASEMISSPTIARLGAEWLERWHRDGGRRPFFLFLHFFDPHSAYIPPPPYDRMFDPDYAGELTGQALARDKSPSRFDLSPRDLEHVLALYDGEIAWTDHHVGLVIDQLQRLGALDRTIVVVTSDHGEEFLERGVIGHRTTLYDEVLRVPLVVRYPPRVPAGLRVSRQVRLMDVAPTLLSLAGLGAPTTTVGQASRDLSPLLAAATASQVPELLAFADLHGQLAAVRTADHKLVEDRRTGARELYDLRRDPRERVDLARSSPQLQLLRASLEDWQRFCRRLAADTELHELDEEQIRALRALGYLD